MMAYNDKAQVYLQNKTLYSAVTVFFGLDARVASPQL
jgi:hypothetical protein